MGGTLLKPVVICTGVSKWKKKIFYNLTRGDSERRANELEVPVEREAERSGT